MAAGIDEVGEALGLDCDALGAGEMRAHWRDHFSHPPLFNRLGCFRVAADPMAVANFMFPPFSGKGEGTAFLHLNGKHPASEDVAVAYQWFPDRAVRRCEMEGFQIETVTRALPDAPGAMIHLRITNPDETPRAMELGVKLAGRLKHTVEGWASIGPAIGVLDEHAENWRWHGGSGLMLFTSGGKAHQAQGVRPLPDSLSEKMLLWNRTLAGGESFEVIFVAALAEGETAAADFAARVLADFDGFGNRQRANWDTMIQSAFQPGNSVFSGHLPTLDTNNRDLLRLYHQATLGCLVLRRDNPLSSYGPAYVTLSPNYWTTASFLWDMMIAAPFYALLDPALLRNHIESWLRAGILGCHATDYVTGRPIGNWYAVNSTAIVRLAHDYLRYTGNLEWLDTTINGKAIIDHLEEHARMWHSYDHHGHGLADCGGVINLLECVTTYTHGVAAFNAMWVAAQRQVAAIRRLRGEVSLAEPLERDATAMLSRVMQLYADGKGYWRCRQPNGSLQDVHHIYDFVAVLESISDDLTEKVRHEMVANFRAHHQTYNWVRSLTNWDGDSHRDLRVDHQWTGSYTSIPAQAINGLYRVGMGDAAFDWLKRLSLVAHQGPVGQAHWTSPLFPAYRGGAWKCTYTEPFITDWTASSNGAYPAMIIESVFGVDATLSRGIRSKGWTAGLDDGARLTNLTYQGAQYTVDKSGIREM